MSDSRVLTWLWAKARKRFSKRTLNAAAWKEFVTT